MSDPPNRSVPENPIDPVTAELVRRKTRQILRQTGRPPTDGEDIEQALTVLLLERLPRFDPAQGARPAFVRMVLRRATANVLRSFRAPKRSGTAVSLDALLRTAGDRAPHPAARDGRPGAADRADLVLDLTAALESLPAELRAIAEQLRTRSVAEAARTLGIPRSTLYERAREIRAAFERRALDEYL